MKDNNNTPAAETSNAHCGPPHIIKITLAKDGMPEVDQQRVDIAAGSRLRFVGPRKFEIRFDGDSPCDANKFSTDDAQLEVTIRRNACFHTEHQAAENQRERVYKYDVIVGDKILDPEIGVHDPS